MATTGGAGRVERVLLFLGLATTRRGLPHWGLYATIAVVSLAVAVASAVAGVERWAVVLLLVGAGGTAVLAGASRRQRRRGAGGRPRGGRTGRAG